jgi:hypothetical protein
LHSKFIVRFAKKGNALLQRARTMSTCGRQLG